jgi:hypothetical protein
MIMEPTPVSFRTRNMFAVSALTRVPIQFRYVMKITVIQAVPRKTHIDGSSSKANALLRYSEKVSESMAVEQGFTTRTQVQAPRNPQVSL